MNFPKAVSMDYIMINGKKKREKERKRLLPVTEKTRCLFQLHKIFQL